MLNLRSIFLFLFLFSSSVVIADELSDARSLVAESELQAMAEAGSAVHQRDLGSIYYYQIEDYQQAAYWYTKAAEQGNATAQYNIGRMYSLGGGVLQDDKQAAYWYTKAAEQGVAPAQSIIGALYYYGVLGFIQDYKKALYWLTEAAEQGVADAQYRLGMIYQGGRGINKDYKQAHIWYNIASANGREDAGEYRSYAEEFMSQRQIAEAQRLAQEWMEAYQDN